MSAHDLVPPSIRGIALVGLPVLLLAAATAWFAGKQGPDAMPRGNAAASRAVATVAASGGAGTFTETQKAAIRDVVKDYLMENPDILLEMQGALEAKMEKAQAERLKAALATNAGDIFRSPDAPIAGNPQGDISVVEFFDYNCGYCKRAFGDIAKLVDQDKKVKLVLKELPILSKGSEEGARVALAARQQGKYWEVHRALINLRGEVNEQTALRAAEKVAGIDIAKLKADMASESVSAEIKRVRDLAQKMGIQGTPHFLVGDRAIPGAPGNLLEQIQTNIAEIRKDGGCKVC
jgi:protein-disulfide isomerase